MSLYEFLFAEFSPGKYVDSAVTLRAGHSAKLPNSPDERLSPVNVPLQKLEARIAELETDLGFLTLVIGVLVQTLEEKDVVTKGELKKKIESIDTLDGISDGKLDIQLLREKLQKLAK